MKRTYHGTFYESNGDGIVSPYEFTMKVELDKNFSFTGTIWESEFSEISGLHVQAKGFIDQNHISFVKTYPIAYEFAADGNVVVDESRKGHEVTFDGYWDENLGVWLGEWEMEGETFFLSFNEIETPIFFGRFEMRMIE